MKNETKAKVPKENKRVKAVGAYSPRILQDKTVSMDHLTEMIAARSSLNAGTVTNVLMELMELMLVFFQLGQAIKVDGLGTFTPVIDIDGGFSIKHLPGKKMKIQMNKNNWFKGTINNKDMIGKTITELVERWNQDHPDEQIK